MSADDDTVAGPRSPKAPVRIDLSEATLEQYDAVLEHLRVRDHYHELRGSILLVQARHEAEVRYLLDHAKPWAPMQLPPYLDAIPAGVAIARRRAARLPTVAGEYELAGRLSRLAGAIVDVVVVGTLVRVAAGAALGGSTGDRERVVLAVTWVVLSLSLVVPTALRGWSLGKLVAGTRVIVPDTGQPPGWPRAVLRWVAPSTPAALGAALVAIDAPVAVASLVYFAGTIAMYAGILFHHERCGLHDLAAGTVVVRARSFRPSGPGG